MPFGLAIGTDRATALQQSIQDELTRRNYSPDPDPVMAEYITIMVINDKTPEQITGELEDLIGSDFDASFTDWLFAEAEKGAEEPVAPAQTGPQQPAELVASVPPPANDSSARRPPRNGIYQQALSQALPSSGQKRAASARSPSPNHAHKMPSLTVLADGETALGRTKFSRTSTPLLETRRPTPEQQQAMMMSAGFPMVMDMSVMNGMVNPLMLQEMMMNQMALMAQMASTMGIINPATGQFGGGFNDPAAFQGQPGMEGGFHGGPQNGRGRGGGRGRGRGGPPSSGPKPMAAENAAIPIVAPTPAPPPAVAPAPTGGLTGYILPERPQSPTLCKFGVKCSNAHCRWSHPSPVATAETGVVLSNEACENGKECKDKDCVKAHVSPAVLNPQAASQPPPAAHHAPPPHVTHPPPSGVPCRFGAACTRTGCTFTHPPNHPSNASNPHFAQPCHFGAACTRANCLFKHPEGRVLPNSFHRGLSAAAPLVSVPNPETGSIGAASHNKSVTFNGSGGASVKEKLEKQMKEIEEQKQAVKAAQEAAKKDKERSAPAAA
ncbi:hypothetical protein MIND_01122100 [Mycena indigotica]|uniref:Nab2 type CCCH zinc finger 4 domain-containing protein n=1 Tax=Mycena indigotica TaxID=2126181 RepID=A0A8H6VVI2_9AGAR|nr:uncharacterized protein MIND_01122100 [Mycena indigotica]KAF7293446.1 hypothetical protein MIND_01122100 [Mycena indigotica]